MHWQRAKKGIPLDAPIELRFSTYEERFAQYAGPPNEDGCRLWTGAIANGYGHVAGGNRGGGRGAHRVAYERATGENLKPYEAIHHICAVRNCVEPSHLQKVSTVENGVEMLERNWYKKRIAELETALSEISPGHDLLTV